LGGGAHYTGHMGRVGAIEVMGGVLWRTACVVNTFVTSKRSKSFLLCLNYNSPISSILDPIEKNGKLLKDLETLFSVSVHLFWSS
jgi:hypothetical protein